MPDVTTNFAWTIPVEYDEIWYQEFIDLMNEIDAEMYLIETGVGKVDHGNLSGLADDDHSQYLNSTRHNVLDHTTALATAVLNDLGDVNVPSPIDGSIIAWSQSTSKWIVGSQLVGDHGELTGLSDDDHSIYFGGSRLPSAGSGASTVFGRLNESLVIRGNLSVSAASGVTSANFFLSGSVTSDLQLTSDLYLGGSVIGAFRITYDTGVGAFTGENVLDIYAIADSATGGTGILRAAYLNSRAVACSIATLTGLHLEFSFGSGGDTPSIDDTYGLYIDNVDSPTGNNYAIYTGTGSVVFGDVVSCASDLRVDGRIFLDANGDDATAYLYFRGTSEYLAWDQSNTRFQLSDELVVAGTYLWIGTTGAADRGLGFLDNQGTHYIYWRNSGQYFEFTGNDPVHLTGTILRVNSDYTSGDVDCLFDFNAGQASMVWDYGNDRFEFSKPIYCDLQAKKLITTSDDDGATLALTDSGKTYTCAASAGSATFTLPSVGSTDVGVWFRFVKLGAGVLIVDAADSDIIADSAAGGVIKNSEATEIYATLTIQLASDTKWVITGAHGTWTTI